jgi:glutaryl-CoA dehydrogenase
MTSIAMLGSEEQQAQYLPRMATCEILGAFALTEPNHGSDVVALETRARRQGDEWVLDSGGSATAPSPTWWWSGPATTTARSVLSSWNTPTARSTRSPGYHARKIVGKAANRGVWQAQIRLDWVRVPAGARLTNARTWDDTNYVLAKSRQTVAWEALGHAVAAYEAALTYSLRREQFGRPLARFQLIQDKLAHMLSDITGMQLMCTRMSQLQAQGRVSIEHAALAKLNTGDGARRVLEVTDSVQVIN